MIYTAHAQLATATTDAAIAGGLSDLTGVLTTNVPTLVAFAVGLIALFFVWRLFKRFIKGR